MDGKTPELPKIDRTDLTPGRPVEITTEMVMAYQRAYTRYLFDGERTEVQIEQYVLGVLPLVEERTRIAIEAVEPLIREVAYQAGREDAARAVEAVFPTLPHPMRAFLDRHRLSDTPSVGAVFAALLADVREVNQQPRTPLQGVGDNTEEQQQGNG